MKFKVKEIKANPFRNLELYPLNDEKIYVLRESIRTTGFWDNVVGRINDKGKPELAYGHHRMAAVKAEYGAGSTQLDVTAVLRKQAGDLPLITLASTSYNTSFGRDPIPGSVKRLRIQYRINGKAGEVSFAENALIILPLPK